jgi:hypothetical protein
VGASALLAPGLAHPSGDPSDTLGLLHHITCPGIGNAIIKIKIIRSGFAGVGRLIGNTKLLP